MQENHITASVFATALLFVTPEALAQNTPNVNTMPLDQLARAIAHTIELSTVRSPGAPLSFDGAAARGASIIVHFTINDAALLVKAKPGLDHMRETTAYTFCRNPERTVVLKRGISLTYIHELADKSDRMEYTIDASACASLAAVKLASPSELALMASEAVTKLRSGEEKARQTQRGVSLKQLDAKDGTVEQRYAVLAPAFESFYRANLPQTQGILKGYVCSGFGDSVRRGLRFHIVYEQGETGAQLSEFNIGPSDC
jgi:hypothetical protein